MSDTISKQAAALRRADTLINALETELGKHIDLTALNPEFQDGLIDAYQEYDEAIRVMNAEPEEAKQREPQQEQFDLEDRKGNHMPQSLSDEFFNGLAGAVDDLREKVEESLWGRAVTEGGPNPRWETEIKPAQEQAQEAPQGLSGEVLPPESPYHEPYQGPSIAYDNTIDGHATQLRDFLGIEPPTQGFADREQTREQDNGLEL